MNLLQPTILWGLAAAVPAVLAEYLYRTIEGPWIKYLWLWVPLQLAIGYCVYKLVTSPSTTLMDAFVIWAFSTMFLRILVSLFLLGDEVKMGTWFALALVLMARVAQTYWK